MCFNALEHADRCRANWPDQGLIVDGIACVPRARCTTCGCFTIPFRVVHDDDGECVVKAPGKYPCPVCGQDDQYIFVWIAARARHHARSREKLQAQGYVTRKHGPLRAPRTEELPRPRGKHAAGIETVGGAASVRSLLVRPGDARLIPTTVDDPTALDCERCLDLLADRRQLISETR